MPKKDKVFKFDFPEEGINEVVAESGNTIIRFREVSWNGRPARLEVRKWRMSTADGEETPSQGLTFASKDIANSLVHTMTKSGFGETQTVLNNISKRNDFEQALVKTIGKEKVVKAKSTEYETNINEEDYFDPKRVMNI